MYERHGVQVMYMDVQMSQSAGMRASDYARERRMYMDVRIPRSACEHRYFCFHAPLESW